MKQIRRMSPAELAAYIQSVLLAALVAKSQKIDLQEIKRGSKLEGKQQEYEIFKKKLR